MKYSVETEINLPRDRVVELFDDPENYVKWQEGLIAYEHLSGTPGQPGVKHRMVFKMGKGRMEMIETIRSKELPDKSEVSYETKGVFNIVQNEFHENGSDKTLWVTHQEFQFRGLMKILGLLKGMFRKQTEKYLNAFREFCEDGKDVRESS